MIQHVIWDEDVPDRIGGFLRVCLADTYVWVDVRAWKVQRKRLAVGELQSADIDLYPTVDVAQKGATDIDDGKLQRCSRRRDNVAGEHDGVAKVRGHGRALFTA